MFKGIINREFDLIKIWAYFNTAKIICLDFETTGLDFISDDVVGISFATDNGLNCYVPFIHDGIPTINIDSFMKQAKPYLEKDGVLILAHNIKFDIQFLWNYGIDIGWKFDKQLVADTQVMSFYLDENRENHKLKYLGRSILKLDMTDFSDLTQFKKLTFNKVPIDDALEYALKDASTPLALYNIFLPQLEKEKIADAFWYMEMPFTKVLAMMERRGVYIDTELMDIYEERIDRELSELHKKLLVLAGREVNINSGDQLAKLLFGKDGFGAPIQTMTDGGKKPRKDGTFAPPKPKTDAEVIETLSKIKDAPWSGFCNALLKYKALKKIDSTYIKGLRELIRADGKVHGSFNQTVAVTGRLTATEPNLQNQPRDATWVDIYFPGDEHEVADLYSTVLNKEGAEKFTIPYKLEDLKVIFPQHKVEELVKDELRKKDKLKEFFKYIPETSDAERYYIVKRKIRDFYYNPYGVLVVSDYSQMEMRVMAHFSGDPGLMEAFERDVDIHSWVASKAFNTEFEKVSKDQRQIAKSIGFGTIFGKTVYGFALDWYSHEKDFWEYKIKNGKRVQEIRKKYLDKAQSFLDDFFAAFGGVKNYMGTVVNYCYKNGFIRTISGRKRRLPGIYDEHSWISDRAKRQAVNTKIQGSAADIIKLAMIDIEKELAGSGIELVIQVHDELVLTTPPDKVEYAEEVVKRHMETVVPLKVKVITEPCFCNRWGAAK